MYSEKERLKALAKYNTADGRYRQYKSRAKCREMSFDLTFEEFKSYWQKPCTYCGSEILTVGIDRVNSSMGYSLDNCVPCCSWCNTIKLNHDLDFLNLHLFKMLKHQGII